MDAFLNQGRIRQRRVRNGLRLSLLCPRHSGPLTPLPSSPPPHPPPLQPLGYAGRFTFTYFAGGVIHDSAAHSRSVVYCHHFDMTEICWMGRKTHFIVVIIYAQNIGVYMQHAKFKKILCYRHLRILHLTSDCPPPHPHTPLRYSHSAMREDLLLPISLAV